MTEKEKMLAKRLNDEVSDALSDPMTKRVASFLVGQLKEPSCPKIITAIKDNPLLSSKEIGEKVIEIAKNSGSKTMSTTQFIEWVSQAIYAISSENKKPIPFENLATFASVLKLFDEYQGVKTIKDNQISISCENRLSKSENIVNEETGILRLMTVEIKVPVTLSCDFKKTPIFVRYDCKTSGGSFSTMKLSDIKAVLQANGFLKKPKEWIQTSIFDLTGGISQ
jgi:hypothetical protein